MGIKRNFGWFPPYNISRPRNVHGNSHIECSKRRMLYRDLLYHGLNTIRKLHRFYIYNSGIMN